MILAFNYIGVIYTCGLSGFYIFYLPKFWIVEKFYTIIEHFGNYFSLFFIPIHFFNRNLQVFHHSLASSETIWPN